MRFSTLDRTVSLLRMCAHCGSRVGACDRNICVHCARRLNSTKLNGWVGGYNLKTLSLYDWCGLNEQRARNVVMSLKGGGPSTIYSGYATALLELRLGLAEIRQKIYFVPAP